MAHGRPRDSTDVVPSEADANIARTSLSLGASINFSLSDNTPSKVGETLDVKQNSSAPNSSRINLVSPPVLNQHLQSPTSDPMILPKKRSSSPRHDTTIRDPGMTDVKSRVRLKRTRRSRRGKGSTRLSLRHSASEGDKQPREQTRGKRKLSLVKHRLTFRTLKDGTNRHVKALATRVPVNIPTG